MTGRTEEKKADKVIGRVYETMDYDKFKFVEGNRDVSPNKKLKESIAKWGIITPIQVNRKMEILEGQHRYTFAREVGQPIKYRYDDTDIDIAELNSTSKLWKIKDYVHQQVVAGNIEYVQLNNLLTEYPVLTIGAVGINGQGVAMLYNSSKKSDIRGGAFKFYNYEEFRKYAKSYTEFIKATRIKPSSGLQLVYFILFIVKGFDPQRFIKKVNASQLTDRMQGVTYAPRILQLFLEANNGGLKPQSKNWINYSIDASDKITITNDFNTKLVAGLPPFKMKP